MELVGAASRDDVDDSAGRLTELSFVSGGQHLKLGNRFLIKLRGSPATERVLVGLAIDQEAVVSGSFSQNRRRIVVADIGLTIYHDAGHELQQVEVVAAVDRQFLDLLRRDGRTRGGGRGVDQLHRGADVDLFLHGADFQVHVETNGAIECYLDGFDVTRGETRG